MGRHTKFWDRPETAEAVAEGTPPAGPQRLAWLGRTPLMPVLAGVIAVGVIAAALSTRQISLNFAGSAPAGPDSAACAGCESLADKAGGQSQSGGPAQGGTPQAQEVPSQAPPSREAARTVRDQAVQVDIRLTKMISGGFTAVAVVRNTSKTAKTWRLAFRIPNAVVVDVQGAALRTTKANGGTTWFTGTATLAAGQALKVPFTANGAWSKPAVCKVNGHACA